MQKILDLALICSNASEGLFVYRKELKFYIKRAIENSIALIVINV